MTLLARTHAEVGTFFEGLELLRPGIVPVADRRGAAPADGEGPIALYGRVGRKPSPPCRPGRRNVPKAPRTAHGARFPGQRDHRAAQ
ncbi:SAM-dependent methyltransferase [Streptomyces sp. NPDC040750]|uniref:SAM-dependent methyltransferase n=1 Tax=Streptomyces sp. NPDC040750 TaxID=3154491 RepID=UPI0033D5AB2F